MDDLISRSALINRFKQLQGSDTLANMFVSDVIKVVKIQPTAYNVDKVVEQLYELGGVDGFDDCAKAYDRAIEDSIKVVKAGGVNE